MTAAAGDRAPAARRLLPATPPAWGGAPWLCIGYGLFIVYGSLLPFHFHPQDVAQAWAAFRETPFLQLGVDSRADWVANGVLYVPLGVLGAQSLRRGAFGWVAAMLLAGVLCAALAFAVEFTQLFFPPRTVSQNDLIAECLGSWLGVAAAPLLEPWQRRLSAAWQGDGARVVHHLLQAYAVGYVLFCFFPYDLLLSAQELQDKARSDAWGWLLATPADWSWQRALLQSGAEVALTMPLGWLLARTANGRRHDLVRGALVGALVGAAIEIGQFFIETGTSQGLSVLSRALGAAAGVAARRGFTGSLEPTRRALARHTPWLAVVYGALLTAASGWWTHPWQGPAGVAATWRDLQLMPFYYHYYTSEAIALYSLCSVAAMYLPLAALCWARGVGPWRAAGLAACLAALIEAAKLLLAGTHPDPTNLLIAATTCGLPLRLLRDRPLHRPGTTAALHAGAPPPATVDRSVDRTDDRANAHRGGGAWLLSAVPAALLGTLWLPLPGPLSLLALATVAASAAAVWWRPALLLAIVPAAMPVFDLAPWSGRFFWDEFDWLLAACLAIGWYRTPAPPAAAARHRLGRLPALAFAGVGAALLISAGRGVWPWPALDANSFTSYYSGFNALRIAKGALWAWLFVACWRRLAAQQPPGAAERFGQGMRIGLALTVIAVCWERAAFVGWFDFAADYRVSGPFSAMHKGGAYVECFLAVASAYALAPLLATPRQRAAGTGAAVALLLGSCYALMVTFSRNGYAAFAWVIVAALIAGVRRGRAGARLPGSLLAAVAVVAVLAASVAGGPFGRERLGHSQQDLATRQAHWADALAMRDTDLATQLFGMGLGRFPETHFWRSREALRAAPFRLEREGDNTFLRLGSGAPVYVEQIVDIGATGQPLTLQARLRVSGGAAASVGVALCRKWLLTSKDCQPGVLAATTATSGAWQTVELTLPPLPPATSAWPLPVKLSVATPSTGPVVDIDDLRLRDADGADRLANGDFSSGMDRWFFVTDVDPPWHIHNLAVAVLFEQGWFGVAAWAVLLLAAVAGGWRRMGRADAVALAAWLGLVAFAVSGSLNTLIDAPRFVWLWLVLAWLCLAGRPDGRRDGPRRAPAR